MMWGLDVAGRARGWQKGLAAWLTLLVAPGLSAAESLSDAPHFSLSPQALYAAASVPRLPDGTAVSLVEVQETYTFDADGSHVYTQYLVYKVLSPAAEESGWNALRINWSPWRGDKPTMRARVVVPDGTAYVLDPATIGDSPASVLDSSIYSDERMLRAPLPAVAPGVVVETEIITKERLPFAGAGSVNRSFLQMVEPIQHYRVTLQAPSAVPLRYRVNAAPGLEPTHTTQGGVNRWVFDSGPTPPIEEFPSGAPGDVYLLPMITFSTGQSWQELAQAYAKIVAERLAAGRVNDLVARLTKGRTTREAKVAALVEYLNREIRYTGIEFDQSSVIPHTIAETLGRKYGDCKDKSLLLVAMLHAAGIPANLALLNAGDQLDVLSDLPGMGMFNHAIVYVPGEPALWIDATAETARFGQLPDLDAGRSALIVDAQTTALTRIPEARSAENVVEETREIRLADYGPASVSEVTIAHGNYEMSFRGAYADIKAKETVEQLTEYVKSEYSAEKLEKLDRSDPRDFSQPFRLTVEGSKARRGYTSLSDALVYIPIDGLFRSLPEELRSPEPTDEENAKATRPRKKRTVDYLLPRPFTAAWHYRIVPPAGFQAAALPESSQRALGPAQFSENFSVEPDGAVRAELRLDTVKRRFTPDEQREMREQVSALLNRETISIKFDLQAHLLLTQGQPRQSFEAYRKLLAQHPKDPVQRLRRANALIEAGMGEAARAEAATAVRLNPKSALAYEIQATILQYDLIGRWHMDGADFAGAAAAYRNAIALDREDHSLVANYAILLEHSARGLRYGRGADLKGAIAAYRQLTSEQLEELNVAQNLAFALFYNGEFAAALEAANALDSPPAQLIVASDAQVNGVQHALAEAQRRSAGNTSFKEIATGAGTMLMNMREYSNAAVLLEAGANGPTTAQTMGLVSILRQARRYEQMEFGTTPEGLVRYGYVLAMKEGDASPETDARRSRHARSEWGRLQPEQREATAQSTKSSIASGERNGMPLDVLIDILMPGIQVKASGDDTVGYRVITQLPGGQTQTLFVVKEDGEYRFLADAMAPIPFASEVLERVQRGDLAGAGTLLGWYREAIATYEGGQDPYAGYPFTGLWRMGQHQADSQAITVAAASIWVTSTSSAQRGVALLEQAKVASTEPQTEAIDLALLVGYEQLRDHERALQAATALAKRTPRSARAFHSQTAHLRALNRFKEADALAEQRLQVMPEDIDALRALAASSAAQGDYAEAYARGLKVVAHPRSGARDLNELAWVSLYFDRDGGPDVESAVRATQLRQNAMAALHTLGCTYAEVGKTREAREVLLQSMELRQLTEPNGDFWYAFGRIAEQYGEREIALANYAKVKPPEDVSETYQSSYQLAQRRMKVLGVR